MSQGETASAAAAPSDAFRRSIAQVLGVETAHAGLTLGEAVDAPETRAMARFNLQETRRQANIERILCLAAQERDTAGEAPLVDPAWLTHFFNYAQDACDEEEQQVWARILGQEFTSAGSFGKRTLAFLSALELWELAGFVEYVAFAFAFESGWRFMFDEESARREIWTYGRELDLTSHFIKIGLLAEDTARINPGVANGLRIRYGDRIYELRGAGASISQASSDDLGVAYRKFTVIGQQLAAVIRPKSFFGYARNVLKALDSMRGIRFELLESPEP